MKIPDNRGNDQQRYQPDGSSDQSLHISQPDIMIDSGHTNDKGHGNTKQSSKNGKDYQDKKTERIGFYE
jgi:hypothetical protein